MRFLSGHAERVVIKLGTNLLTAGGGRLDVVRVSGICTQIAAMRAKGLQVVVVSSGAVGLGMGKLGLLRRPTELASLQACAAIGQSLLMETWQQCFQQHGIIVAQILLTREDVRHRERHLAITHTLEHLLKLGVVPIVNENDTVSAAEIKFGDNDILSALTASLIQAHLLVILSTIPGLLDLKGDGKVVPVVAQIDERIEAMAGGTTSATAVGGMRSKIEAAKVATKSGCGVFIGSGEHPALLAELMEGRALGTFFCSCQIKTGSP
ncbi:MAG: glutamate 5-kinase [Verrucomicrobia bacterium]|nr:glutamate 5-kinase [Verrucomicrobiota bacterium]